MSGIKQSLVRACERVSNEETSYKDLVLSLSKSKDEIDSLILNHALPASEVANLCGMNHVSFKNLYNEALEKGIIPEVMKTANQYKYTLDHIHALMDYVNMPRWSDKHKKAHVISISNLKGGTGKSTTASSLAASLALSLKDRKRVALIDLDPQGSQSQSSNIDVAGDVSILTTVDLMLGDMEQGSEYEELKRQGYSHEQIVLESMIDTHIPNLHVLPSFPDDERFNSSAWSQLIEDNKLDENAKMSHLNLLKDRVISVLEDHYDIILIDTAPQMNPLIWSAFEAANGLLVPCTPHALDWTSTQSFLNSLEGILDSLPSEGENLRWWKVLCTNFDDEHNRDQAILDRMKDALRSDLFNNSILRSQAFEKASQTYRTVLDLRKSEKICSARQFDKAVSSLGSVTRELTLFLSDIKL